MATATTATKSLRHPTCSFHSASSALQGPLKQKGMLPSNPTTNSKPPIANQLLTKTATGKQVSLQLCIERETDTLAHLLRTRFLLFPSCASETPTSAGSHRTSNSKPTIANTTVQHSKKKATIGKQIHRKPYAFCSPLLRTFFLLFPLALQRLFQQKGHGRKQTNNSKPTNNGKHYSTPIGKQSSHFI